MRKGLGRTYQVEVTWKESGTLPEVVAQPHSDLEADPTISLPEAVAPSSSSSSNFVDAPKDTRLGDSHDLKASSQKRLVPEDESDVEADPIDTFLDNPDKLCRKLDVFYRHVKTEEKVHKEAIAEELKETPDDDFVPDYQEQDALDY